MKRKLFCVWMCIAMIVTLMPSMAFADETSANDTIAATIAIVDEDENGRESYNTGTITMDVEPGNLAESCVIGIGTATDFCPMSGSPDSYTISVKKDEWAEAVTKKKPNEEAPLCAGAFLGWYNNEEETFYLGYNQEAILPSADAYGDYQITITWTQDEKTYVASTTLTLQGTAKLLRGEFDEPPENYETEKGFLCSWITLGEMKKNETEQFMLNYAPYYDYQGNPEKYTMLYSDEKQGIFSFMESNCDVEGLFTKGDTVSYKNDLEISPLLLDYSKVTADMIGKNYTLSFMSDTGEIATCSVAVTLRNELDYLEDGQVYIIENGRVREDGRLYIANWEDRVQYLVKSEFSDQIKREMEIRRYHFGIWNKTNSSFTPVEISCDDAAVTISGSKKQGYELYAEQETTGTFVTTDGTHIRYTFSLPEAGFYRTSVRSAESYLAEAVYLAEETLQDNHYTFYYIAQADEAFPKNDLQVGYKLSNSISVTSINDWVDNETGTTYYAWQINMDEQFNTDEGFWIEVSGQKNEQFYYRQDWLTIHDTDVVPKNQRLYWFNASEVQVDADGAIQLRDEAGGSVDEYASFEENWTIRTSNIKSYFAVKRDEKYFAVDDVQLTYTEGMSMSASTTEPYLYTLIWTTFGTYQFKAVVDEKEYRFIFNVSLPDAGFYSTGLRSESSYIEEEFHFINASEKSQDGTEAYFYLIAPTYDYSLNQISVSFGKWLSEEEIEGNVWTEKKISGMEIGTPQMATFDNENYAVWKITVSDTYRAPYGNGSWQGLRIIYGSGTEEENTGLDVYDSTEIPKKEQLYWLYDSDDSSEIEIDESGKMSLSGDSEDSLDDRANTRFYWNNKSGSTEGYFAVKKDGEYYALRTVQTSETEGISLNASADIPYLYKLEWSKFGEYHIIATENEMEYRLNFNVKLPEIGVYSTSDRNEGAYLDKFYYTTASDKNPDGTEAYFYLIAPTYGYTTEQMELSFGEWTWNEATDEELWSETIVTGLSAGSPEIKEFGNEEYAVWKITVSDAYQNPYANRQELRIAYGKEGMSRTKSIIIYDSTEISEEEQLYWFYDSSNIEIDESGKMSLSSDSEGSLDGRAYKQIRWNDKSGSMEGYFAVKKNGEYYALRTVQTSETEGISVTEYADTPYLYKVEWSEFGKYHITATDNGAEYRLNFNVELPEIGFYSTSNRSEETYLDEFYYADAVEKSKDGKEAYFYYIAPTDGFTKSQIRAFFTEYIRNEETGEGNWEEKSIPGISIAQYETKFFDENEYVIFQIAVSNQYKYDIEMSDKECVRIVYDKGEGWRADWNYIKIYDASIVPPSQQLYFFDDYDVTLGSDGKLESKDMNSLSTLARRKLFGGNGWSYNGYFAVKEGSEYYAVTSVSAPENVICAKADDDSYSCRITKIGDYEITAAYKGQTYRINAIYSLPSSGFFAKPEKTAENYLYEQFWVQDAIEKSEDGTECYFYLFRDNLDDTESDEIKLTSNSREEEDTAGIKIEIQSKVKKGRITYWIYKITVPTTYTAEGNHSESWEMRTDNCRFSIEMFDTGAIRPEQQLYWVYKDDAQVENGKLRPAEENSTLYPRTEMNLVYNTPWAREGYFAVLKDGEYYPVNNISATDEVTATLDEDSGAFSLVSKHVGEYTITYNDGKQEYYFKSKVVLPTAGCFTSQTYTEEAFIADLFDYNTADKNKHFYFIAKENLIKRSSDPESVQLKLTEGEPHDGVGIGVGESGTFKENGETYYYWEIKVDKSFQHSSDYVQYVVELKDGNNILYGQVLKIRGYVKYGDVDKNDKTDFADALWLKRYLADWDNYRYIGRREADLDRDGKITASDLMILERHIASWKGYEKLPKVS